MYTLIIGEKESLGSSAMEFAFHCRMGGLEQAQQISVWRYMCASRSQVRVTALSSLHQELFLLPSFYKLSH